MSKTSLKVVRGALVGALVLLLVPAAAGAIQHEVRIYLDLDDDTATGCEVTTVDGPFAGAEQVLITTVETTASPDAGTVTDAALADCDEGTNTFGIPTSFDGNWPVGVGNGVGGRDVVETYAPLLSLVIQDPSIVHVGLVVTDEQGGEEALLTVDGTPEGDPILLNLQSLLEIPTLGEWGLILLALLLAAASIHLMGRRGTAALGLALLVLATGVAWAAGTLDGLTDDWSAADQLAANGLVLFGKELGDQLCFRVDVDLLFNQPPTITDIADQTIPEDGTTGPLAFTVGDPESPANTLTVSATSSNQVLVPNGNLTLGGSGANRTIEVTPAADQNGMTDVTVTVEDPDGGTASTTFKVTVTSDNDPPTISAIVDQTIDEDTSTGALAFTVGDVETPPGSLTVTAASDDQTIIPDGNLALAGTDENRTITVTPAADQNGGPVTITVTVQDSDGGSVAEQFDVTVDPVNDAPTITAIADQTIDEDTSTGALPFTIDDVDDAVGTLTVSATSSDQTLIPDGNLTIGGTAPNLTIEATPAANENGGPATITVTVTDPSAAAGVETFDVTVNPVNDPPAVLGETFDVAAGNFEPAIGNTTLQFANAETATEPHVFQSGDVLDNDTDVENDPLSITAVNGDGAAVDSAKTLPSSAVVTLEADGEFTYSPPLGFEGNDSFTYTVFDGTDSSTATVNVEIAGMVWYLDNDPANDGTGDDGRAASPFDTIAQFDAENGAGGADDPEAGDTIFLFEGTATYDAGDTDGIDLLDGQKLYGEGVALVVGSSTLVPAGNRPAIDNPNGGGDAVTVLADVTEGNKTGVEIRGLEISGDDNAVEVTSADAAQVGVTISDNLFAASGGPAIDANPGSSGAFDLTVENNSYATSSPTGNGIDVATALGNSADVEVAIKGNTDVTSSSGVGINLNGSLGSGTLFVTGFADNTVHGNTGGAGVMAADVTFDADPSDTDFDEVAAGTWSVGSGANPVGGAGVYLGTVAAAVEGNLSFTQLDAFAGNGAGLDVAGAGLFGGGTPGSGFQLVIGTGTINATNGPAVTIDPATVNATFASLTSNDSLTSGISLTDVAGSFTATTVAIDDTAGAGVAIANSSATVALNGGFIGETVGTVATTGGNAVDIDGSSGNVTIAADVINASARSVEVTNHTGGATVTFSGAIDDDAAGVLLTNNGASGGATIDFTGGLDLATTTNDAFTATGGGTVNVADGIVTNTITTTTGTGVNVANTTIGPTGVTFDSVSTNGAANGILLASTGTGDFAANGGSIVNASSRGVDLNSVSGDFTYAGSISTTAAGRSVEVTNHSGGTQAGGTTVALTGAITDTGLGIHLDNNDAGTGATVRISGGLDLDTGTNTAFNATNGGTVEVLDGGVTNDIDTTTGVGVNIANTTIGASEVTFDSVSVNGATNGIVLNATGSSGGINVTGDGSTAGSGGTIQNTTSDGVSLTSTQHTDLRFMTIGDGTATAGQAPDGTVNVAGDGISMSSVEDAAFRNLKIARTGAHGIDGTDVTALTIEDTQILNAGDGNDEHGLAFDGVGSNNLDGTVTLTDVEVDGSSNHSMFVQNSSGTLNLTVQGTALASCRFANTTGSSFGEEGIQLDSRGTADMTVVVDTCTFEDLESDGITAFAQENSGATLDLTVQNSLFNGCGAGTCSATGSDNALAIRTGGNGVLDFDVVGNDIDANNAAILIQSNDTSTLRGLLDANDIGDDGVADSGSIAGRGIDIFADDNSIAIIQIEDSDIDGTDFEGIFALANDGTGGTPSLHVTLLRNDVATPDDNSAFPLTFVNSIHVRALNSASLCADIRQNTASAGTDGAGAFRLQQRDTATFQVERLALGAQTPATTETHVEGENPASGAVDAVADTSFTGVADGTCSTPP